MALKNGILFSGFSAALKGAYLDVASRQLAAAGTVVSAEGICVITGIDKTEAETLLRGDPHSNEFALAVQSDSPLPRLLNAWHTDTRYTGPYGVLRDLPFERSGSTDELTFSDLATEYCPGISPRVMLDELLRTDSVQAVGNGVYRASTRSYVPDPLSDESIRLVAQVVHNLCETLEVNLRPESAGGNGLMQRIVYTEAGLSPAAMQEFNLYLRERGQLFTEQVDDWLVNHEDSEKTPNSCLTGVGLFHYLVNTGDENDLDKYFASTGDKNV
jgi:hypothetical protein